MHSSPLGGTMGATILGEMCQRDHASRAAEIIIAMCEQFEIKSAAETLQIMLLASEASTNNNAAFILNYMFNNSLDKMIIVEIFTAMTHFHRKNILKDNQAMREILVRALCHETIFPDKRFALFNRMIRSSSELRNIACNAISQIESENVDQAKKCFENLNVESITYIFAEKLKSTNGALIFWKKIRSFDPKKAIEIFRRLMGNHNLTESLASFLLEMDRQNSENPGTSPSASKFLPCQDFNPKDVARILTCNSMPKKKAIEIMGEMYHLNSKKTIEIFIEVAAMGVRVVCSRKIGVKILLKMDEIDSENPSNPRAVVEVASIRDSAMESFVRYTFFQSNFVDINRAAKILKDLHEANSSVAARAFGWLLENSERKAAETFLELYRSEVDHQVALKILSDSIIEPNDRIKLLLSDSLGDDNALKILKDLYKMNFYVVERAFRVMGISTEQVNRRSEILLKLYQSADGYKITINILSKSAISFICEILLSDSMGDDNAAKILKDLHAIDPSVVVDFCNNMSRFTGQINKITKIFLKLYQSVDGHQVALKILSDDAMRPQSICTFLGSNHISPGQMANVLNIICTPNAVNKIARVLSFMYATPELQSKVVSALERMDQDKVDSLLNTQALRPYAAAIRSVMARKTEEDFISIMQRHEEEFAARFHALNAAVEQVESESTDILQNVEQNEDIPADEFPLAEKTPRDEVPLDEDAEDGKISLEEPKIPPPSRLERFKEFLTGTVGKVLIAVAVAAISGLVLWAVTLWPLAALIGAGCTTVALSGILFFRNRRANGSKSQEVNPLNFDGDDPLHVAEDRGLYI
ncbi:MAG: hypothetical protein LBI69_04245 [Puniceicoccales bacterium]|nr:hypothetical protein [Puniceicoccales bacterium]